MTEIKDYWKVGQKAKLIDLRDEGYHYALVKAKQGDVWINLFAPDVSDATKTIEDTIYFWGRYPNKVGEWIPYGEIFDILEVR